MALSPQLTAHLMAPGHVGELVEGPGRGTGQGENASCGDVLVVQLRFGPVLELAWRAQACGAVIAVASLAAAALTGLTREEVASFDVAGAVAEAGGLDRRQAHAVRVFERALAQALASAT